MFLHIKLWKYGLCSLNIDFVCMTKNITTVYTVFAICCCTLCMSCMTEIYITSSLILLPYSVYHHICTMFTLELFCFVPSGCTTQQYHVLSSAGAVKLVHDPSVDTAAPETVQDAVWGTLQGMFPCTQCTKFLAHDHHHLHN